MRVRDILAGKGTKSDESGSRLYQIGERDLIGDAITKMVDYQVGSLIVTDDEGEIVGILTERDVLRKYEDLEDNFKHMRVHKAMTKDLIMITPSDHVHYVMELMTEHNIRHLPVITNKEIAGVISIRDVLSTLYQETKEDKEFLQKYISGTYPA